MRPVKIIAQRNNEMTKDEKSVLFTSILQLLTSNFYLLTSNISYQTSNFISRVIVIHLEIFMFALRVREITFFHIGFLITRRSCEHL